MKHELNSKNTKQMLCDTLIQLSSQKPFSKITVSEIIKLCDVNRKTFYYHFADVYDLLEWHLNNEITAAVSTYNHPLDDWCESISYATNYMNQHSYLKNFIKDPLAKDTMTKLLNRTIYPRALEIIEHQEQKHAKSFKPDFKEFLTNNFTHIIVLSVLDSIENPNNYDAEKLKQYLSVVLEASLNAFFEQL